MLASTLGKPPVIGHDGQWKVLRHVDRRHQVNRVERCHGEGGDRLGFGKYVLLDSFILDWNGSNAPQELLGNRQKFGGNALRCEFFVATPRQTTELDPQQSTR